MKKALALLVVLVVLAIPVIGMASTPANITAAAVDFHGVPSVTTANYDFYMIADPATVVVNPPIVVIPAAGPVVASGIAMILATLGCALIPKK